MPTRIAVVGATGSIGSQALDIISRFPDQFDLVGAVAGHRVSALAEALAPFPRCRQVVIDPDRPPLPGVAVGAEAACELAGDPDLDLVLICGGAASSLGATLAACRAGHAVALATKEVLVMAGELVRAEAAASGAQLVPVDSEHSAIWQCLRGEEIGSVSRLILTASGGPVRHRPIEELSQVTPAEALAHPNWDMGPKVTVDTATMVNKGLEVIEAHFLFDIPYDQIEVVIHPQSAVHSAVAFCDGTVMAQLGVADMRAPIALALSGGRRLPGVVPDLDFGSGLKIAFEAVDPARYPALPLVIEAGRRGGTLPAVVNAANEVAVAAFLSGEMSFTGIAALLDQVLSACVPQLTADLEAVLASDRWARAEALAVIGRASQVA